MRLMPRGATVVHAPATAVRGITLVELTVCVGIVAILASLAYPSYTRHIQRSRRAEAVATLLQIQIAQERWRSSNASYADRLETLNLSHLASPPETHYRFSLTLDKTGTYVATATATGAQARDTACSTLSLTLRAGQPLRSSTGSAEPDECWGSP